jgi:hypothetical protein
MAQEAVLRLWDDNPSLVDLLGFDAVVDPIVTAIGADHVDPLAIGVHSPWGGGKSTVLNLLEAELAEKPGYVVIRIDPWQYDNHADVRGDLIVEVLDQLAERFGTGQAIKNQITDLVKRLSWARIGLTLGKGALTMQWDVDELIKAFTPRGRTDELSMAGFKEQFARLVEDLPSVERVVVLVDDLDRCLPSAVMATLESIKLFLAVPQMAFVIAADQDMVRDSITVSLGETNRSGAFAVRYLEKIIQLPITLPRLAITDAEAYIGLLLSAADGAGEDALKSLSDLCARRRNEGLVPLLGGLGDLGWQPGEETLALAAQLAEGLSADRLANPRQIKRFLNAFGVRSIMARSRRIEIEPAVLVKMLLLEDLHRSSFETLAGKAVPDRPAFLKAWEDWAADRASADSAVPEGVRADTRHWAACPPELAEKNLAQYLSLAASLLNVRAGEQASDAVIRLVGDLLGDGETAREAALTGLTGLTDPEQRAAMEFAFGQGRSLTDVDVLFEMTIRWADQAHSLADLVTAAAEEMLHRLGPGVPARMGGSPLRSRYEHIIRRLAAEAGIDGMVQTAARMELESASGH